MTPPGLDELDHRLIAALAEDARVSNRRIASRLGVTEGTVRGRLKRLQQDGLIAFTAITSFDVSEARNLAFIRAQVDPTRLRGVAQLAAQIPRVDAVTIAIGRFNLILTCLISEVSDLYEIASKQLMAMEGVHQVTTAIAVKTLKYDPMIVKITRRTDAGCASLPEHGFFGSISVQISLPA